MKLAKNVFFLIFILISVLYIIFNIYFREQFINYPQQVNLQKEIPSDPDTNIANQNYAELLNYISKNPGNSVKFIEDIRNKFFDSSCLIKSHINFPTLLNKSSLVF